MVKINYRVMIAGIAALVIIAVTLIICDHDSTAIIGSIVAGVALITGVVIPTPKINNKGDMKLW